MATEAARILHISDLHLIHPGRVQRWLSYLSHLPLDPGQVWQREDYDISDALPGEIDALSRGADSMTVLSGDIGTYPRDAPSEIDNHQFVVVNKMQGEVYPILGNHDWREDSTTNYAASRFQSKFEIANLRTKLYVGGGIKVLFFLIDTNIRMFPPWGDVDPVTLGWLRAAFAGGRRGQIENLSADEYAKVIKVLVLHHQPIERAQFLGSVGRIEYFELQLFDRSSLLQECKNDIDIMLFGHTHVPVNIAWNGFLMVSCGTTSGLGGWKGDNILQRLTIYDDQRVNVQPFRWNGLRFVPQPRSVRYRRGAAVGPVVGSGRWG